MKKILIVDDDQSVRETYGDLFELYDVEVSLADGGLKAISAINNQHFDLILLDILMPNQNGLETYRKIKKISPATPVLAMTAMSADPLAKNIIEEGAIGILFKPFPVSAVFPYL